ncbi:hypothetical protein ACN6KF_001484 [Labrys sp. La1]|uniref:hypothetical protein n=1 Tax=Labrys sp. La1 TaxID=3404917 RepID=UPI003EB8D927
MTKTETGGAFPAHTPTPWSLLPPDTDANGYHLVVGGTGQNYGLVATVTLRTDAEHIVTAVNAYEPDQARIAELTEALLWAMDEIDVLSNKLFGFAYPQGMAFGHREGQLPKYEQAIRARRAALEKRHV